MVCLKFIPSYTSVSIKLEKVLNVENWINSTRNIYSLEEKLELLLIPDANIDSKQMAKNKIESI